MRIDDVLKRHEDLIQRLLGRTEAQDQQIQELLTASLTFGTYADIPEAAAPGTPAAGYVRFYAKADGRLYSKDDAGAESGAAVTIRTKTQLNTLYGDNATGDISAEDLRDLVDTAIRDTPTAAGASAFGDAASGGASEELSKVDHKHSRESNPVTAHEAAGDPHTGYRLESADHSHQTTGAQAGKIDHGAALNGLADDDHAAYLLASDATSRAAFASNWTDLTDGGASALHSHAGGGAPTDADYLVGTAHAGLSAEIVVGATPGGELGGTWAAPTVDATHAGSTHSAATDTHIADATDAHAASAVTNTPAGTVAATTVQAAIDELATDYAAADSTHAGAADPHAGYVLESLIDAAGDIYKGSADNTVARLAAPTNHHFLGGTGVTYQAAIEAGVYASRPAASTANIGRLYRATDRANTLYQCSDATTWVVVNPRTYTMTWYLDGRLRADAAASQGPIRYLPDLDGITTETVALWKPVRCKVHVKTASAGASIIAQIEFGTTATPGTDLFASGDRPTIAAAGNEATSTTFADSAIENGTAFELVIDQVGSTAGSEGQDLSVELEFVQIDA